MNKDVISGYPFGGKMYPGVTTVLDYALGLPSFLLDWATKKGVLKVLAQQKKEKKFFNQKEVIEIALSARQDILAEAQERGTAVHSYAEAVLKFDSSKIFPEQFLLYYNAFNEWVNKNPLKAIHQEQFVINYLAEYAGRFDFYGILNGERVLIDFKTSNFMKPEYGLQLAAYAECLLHMGHPVDRKFVLYIKPLKEGGCVLIEYKDTYEDFLNVKKVFDWKVERKNPDWKLRMTEKEVAEEHNFRPESPSLD